MSDEQIEHHLQFIKQQISALRGERDVDWEAIDAAIEDLHVVYEQMQTSLEAAEVVEEELVQQKQYYQDLFQFFPIASFITDVNGLILEANQALTQLLNVSYSYLIGKPLAVFIAEGDRATFRTHLNQLSQKSNIQIWRVGLCPRNRQSIMADLHVSTVRNIDGQVEHLRIGVYNLSQSQESIPPVIDRTSVAPEFSKTLIARLQHRLNVPTTEQSMPQLAKSLDGLRVLVVDDESDIREFITTVLESQGIGVRTVASAAAALEELERFRPDVLLSDIRMPGEDGYSLIRQIRALEAEQGGHLPAVAITAYLDEDREKSLQAGFEAYLYKLMEPNEWVEIVAQVAGKGNK